MPSPPSRLRLDFAARRLAAGDSAAEAARTAGMSEEELGALAEDPFFRTALDAARRNAARTKSERYERNKSLLQDRLEMLVELGDLRVTLWALRQLDLLRSEARDLMLPAADPMDRFMSARTPADLAMLAGCDRPTLRVADLMPPPNSEQLAAICDVLDAIPTPRGDLYSVDEMLSDEEKRQLLVDYVHGFRDTRLNLEQYEQERVAWATRVAAAEAAGVVAPGVVPVPPKLEEIDVASVREGAVERYDDRADPGEHRAPSIAAPAATLNVCKSASIPGKAGAAEPASSALALDVTCYAPQPVGAMICYPPRELPPPAAAPSADSSPKPTSQAPTRKEVPEAQRSATSTKKASKHRSSGIHSPTSPKKTKSGSVPAASAEPGSRDIRWGKEPVPPQTLAPFRRWPGAP